MKTSKRENALYWWRQLPKEKQDEMCVKYFPTVDPLLVRTSSMRIEQIHEIETR